MNPTPLHQINGTPGRSPLWWLWLIPLTATIFVILTSCSEAGHDTSPASATTVERSDTTQPGAAPHTAPGSTTLHLPAGGPPSLHLPPGATAQLDLNGKTPAMVVTLPDTLLGFQLGSDTPSDPTAATATLGQLVPSLGEHTDIGAPISVTGYASSEGPAELNQALSERRARWVCTTLIVTGISADKLTCEGRGATSDLPPTGPGPEDRRVEIRLRSSA